MRVLKYAAILAAMAVLVTLAGCGPRAQNPRERYPAPSIEGWTYVEIEPNQQLIFEGPQGVTQTVRLAQWCTSIQSSCLKGTPELAVESYVQPREAVWDGQVGFKVKMFWPAPGVLGVYYQGEGWSVQDKPALTPISAATPAGTDLSFEKGFIAACQKGETVQRIWMTLDFIQSAFPVVGNPPLDHEGAAVDGVYTAQNGGLSITVSGRSFTIRSDAVWVCSKETLTFAP